MTSRSAVEKGRVLGLIGESGAGKSTIGLSAMAYGRGGVRLTGGQVLLNGRDIRAGRCRPMLRALRGHEVTYVAQSAAAAFNPAKRLMEQVIETTPVHRLMTTRRGRGAARSSCSASWACPTPKPLAAAIRIRCRAGSCSAR